MAKSLDELKKIKQDILKKFHPKFKHRYKEEVLAIDRNKIREMEELEQLEEKYEKIRIKKKNKARKQKKKGEV